MDEIVGIERVSDIFRRVLLPPLAMPSPDKLIHFLGVTDPDLGLTREMMGEHHRRSRGGTVPAAVLSVPLVGVKAQIRAVGRSGREEGGGRVTGPDPDLEDGPGG